MVNWLDDLPAAYEKYKREHPEQFQEQMTPLRPLSPYQGTPLQGPDTTPPPSGGSDWTQPEPDKTPLDPGWADEWRKAWQQRDQQQQIPPPPAGTRRIEANAGGLLGDTALLGGGGGGLLGGAGNDTLNGMPLDASSPISMMNPNMQNTPPLAGDASLLGSSGGDLAGGGGDNLGVPADNGSNPSFFNRLFGGAGRDRLGTGNAWGPALMQLGGGIAAGATEGWGAGIGKGLGLAGASLQRSRELAQAAQAKKDEQAIQQRQFEEQMKLKREELAAKPTGTTLERNLLGAGLKPGTPEWNDAMMKAITKPQTNIALQGETAQAKQVGELTGKKLGALDEANTSSMAKVDMLNTMETLVDNPNVYQGPGGDTVGQIKRWGETFGLPVQGTDATTAFQSLTNQMALKLRNPSGGEGMPGSLSNTDRDFLVASVPGLTRGKSGNKLTIEIMRRLETRKQAENTEAMTFMTEGGGNVGSLSKHMQEWRKHQPNLFDDLKDKVPAPEGGTDGGGEKPAQGYLEYFKGLGGGL